MGQGQEQIWLVTHCFLPQFSLLKSGDTKITLIELFLKMNQLMSVKPLCWASVTRVVNIIIIILFDFVVITVISVIVVVN